MQMLPMLPLLRLLLPLLRLRRPFCCLLQSLLPRRACPELLKQLVIALLLLGSQLGGRRPLLNKRLAQAECWPHLCRCTAGRVGAVRGNSLGAQGRQGRSYRRHRLGWRAAALHAQEQVIKGRLWLVCRLQMLLLLPLLLLLLLLLRLHRPLCYLLQSLLPRRARPELLKQLVIALLLLGSQLSGRRPLLDRRLAQHFDTVQGECWPHLCRCTAGRVGAVRGNSLGAQGCQGRSYRRHRLGWRAAALHAQEQVIKGRL
jgi:hypothetical protein